MTFPFNENWPYKLNWGHNRFILRAPFSLHIFYKIQKHVASTNTFKFSRYEVEVENTILYKESAEKTESTVLRDHQGWWKGVQKVYRVYITFGSPLGDIWGLLWNTLRILTSFPYSKKKRKEKGLNKIVLLKFYTFYQLFCQFIYKNMRSESRLLFKT